MGAEASKVATTEAVNPCATEMETYIKCVESKNAESGGLRDGDECEKESEAYRECRRIAKELKKATAAAQKN
ncbi:hypothetical protein Poli38472_007792 [Pythium oligandrum]|uniref:CHCH domain-containing protein n=1 Tax=Pythium oligandrum TaxID=41045 RepID=A0A8K1CSX1_PYTOL|nr:hypothetical protein Poli38472_007792 [Pythium oligandrum]|eukprot:TMW68120.1 hypothetical protein Poli38472_007792 [Pythium oligandrum]